MKAMLGIAALVPLMTGPLPQEETALLVSLCGGGEISIPLSDDEGQGRECDPQACHAGTCRSKLKKSDLI
ncbi:hypothetical protein [Erythrobacter sp. YT30]|uniref:hypothetical protein n=1 Tax=Erythrobacter sp. YT30 TaxID=1735012 RepID=UPI00076C9BF7|nr:hypothetical protein [Erythrobacter sp. YT30]KWV92060.1 hypothetical protein AUC45_12995 [Erythrobacter sp. YT30]